MDDLIINEINVSQTLKTSLSKLTKGWISLLKIPVGSTLAINLETIRILQEQNYEGIYITLSKECTELLTIFKERELDLSKIFFIDGISQLYGSKTVESPNVVYIDGPLSIDAIIEQIKHFCEKISGQKKFVFLDSITTVLLYNSLERTVNFSRFLLSTLKEIEMAGVVVSVSEGFANNSLLQELSILSDEIIQLRK